MVDPGVIPESLPGMIVLPDNAPSVSGFMDDGGRECLGTVLDAERGAILRTAVERSNNVQLVLESLARGDHES